MHNPKTVSHSCDCKSGNRTLILLPGDFSKMVSAFSAFGEKENWRFIPDYEVIEIKIGAGKHWINTAEVYNFLQTVSGERELAEMRVAWLDSSRPLAQQLTKLGNIAEAFDKFISRESSQLLDILQNRRIETWFQPVIEAESLNLWGYECLMRGRLAGGSLIGAPQLLEWAERENLKFMLDRVCRETHLENAGKLNYAPGCRFLINFLPTAIYNPEYCLQTSLAAMRRSGLVPSQVIFEVVESEKVIDTDHLLNILNFYREAGFGVALDDMGSGFSGLNLLADLQPDLIKLDREIVSKSVTSKSHLNVCASLVRMGHDNRQLVLAEGVETETEVRVMNSLGVDLFQGYYFGKPMPIQSPVVGVSPAPLIETFA